MFNFKTLVVEKQINCPLCGEGLKLGDTMFHDKERDETICCYCKEDYKQSVILEEGEDGRLLK